MPEGVLPALRDLIGFDSGSFVGIDNAADVEYLFQTYAHGCEEGPLTHQEQGELYFEHERSTQCTHPYVPDDLPSILGAHDGESVRQWHNCRMYVEMYHPAGDEHLLVVRIPDGLDRTLRLLCWRGPGRDFGPREKTDLLLLLPHLEAAYRRVQREQALSGLTMRQRQLLELVGQGCTNHQVARRLGVSEGTVRTHLNNIYSRLGVASRTAAVTRSQVIVQH
jgi:DNA-binding CsgD family transcriptional regulator